MAYFLDHEVHNFHLRKIEHYSNLDFNLISKVGNESLVLQSGNVEAVSTARR